MSKAKMDFVGNCIQSIARLATPPFATLDPFLFCVYHKDNYPAGNIKLEAPRMGNGQDFDPDAPYRMYHGDKVPGFPAHPHRGFETITATLEGIIDHADSKGNAGRYGFGDNQWMTAGAGVQHSEMFPLVNQNQTNPTRFFQIWLNLPGKSKMVDPFFVMHWGEEVPKIVTEDGLASGILYAGELMGQRGLPPPPNSWASDQNNEVGVLHLTLKPGAEISLPPARGGQAINRQVYFLEGPALGIGERVLDSHSIITLNAGATAVLTNPGSKDSEVLVLQGRPIGEPVVQHGPFVMNTKAEIQQTFLDYQKTQFGGWPWESTAQVFAQSKGRFALLNGVESFPPAQQCAPEEMSIKALKEAIARAGLTPQSLGFNEKREFVELLQAHQSKQ